jgi:hypothetical protein
VRQPIEENGTTEALMKAAPPFVDVLQAELDTMKRMQTKNAAESDALLPSILAKAFKNEL